MVVKSCSARKAEMVALNCKASGVHDIYLMTSRWKKINSSSYIDISQGNSREHVNLQPTLF